MEQTDDEEWPAVEDEEDKPSVWTEDFNDGHISYILRSLNPAPSPPWKNLSC